MSDTPAVIGRGLCLASTATLPTRTGQQLWRRSADTSGTSDKRPVLAQHAGQGALVVDHECFTQAWTRDAWNPATRDCEGTRRQTVSLRRTGVPKPTCTHSFCTDSKRKWKKGERRCACAHNQLATTGNWLSPLPHAYRRPFLPRMKTGVSWPRFYEHSRSANRRPARTGQAPERHDPVPARPRRHPQL